MKAILILDEMPKSCNECQLKVLDADLYYTTYACKNVACETDDILETTKYEMNCPLKRLPKKKEIKEVKQLKDFTEQYSDIGFNACLDEILGGN